MHGMAQANQIENQLIVPWNMPVLDTDRMSKSFYTDNVTDVHLYTLDYPMFDVHCILRP